MIAAMLPLGTLPADLRFDGIMPGDGCNFLQFTELDQWVASYGASFYIDSKTVLLDAVTRRREEKRVEFAAGAVARRDLELKRLEAAAK
jgi:hypothetical protein